MKFTPHQKNITLRKPKNKYEAAIRKSENILPKLKRELWEVFSEYIRLRDTLPDGTFICISAGKRMSAKNNIQAGHYYKSETYPALRYDEHNVNGQSMHENIFREGNRQGYEKNLRKKIGDAAMEILDRKKNNKVDYSQFVLRALIAEYKEKVNRIKIEREIEHTSKIN